MIHTLHLFVLLPVPGFEDKIAASHVTLAWVDKAVRMSVGGPTSDIALPDHSVPHCLIEADERVMAMDLGNTPQTKLNGVNLGKVTLSLGDTMRFHSATLQYVGCTRLVMANGATVPRLQIQPIGSTAATASPAKHAPAPPPRKHVRRFLDMPRLTFGTSGPSSTLTPHQVNVLVREAVRYGELPALEKKAARHRLETLLTGMGQCASNHLPKETES